MRPVATMLTLAVVWSVPAFAQIEVPDSLRQAAASAPVFASHDPLRLTLEAPLNTIFRHRDQESEEYPGTLTHHQADGQDAKLNVKIRTRGKTRLTRRICEFPPLRLNFEKGQVASTTFRGQDKLKLAVHCQSNRAEYEQYVLQEYLVYRVFNLLSDLSFRARLTRTTYVDTDGKLDTLTRFGFLIEDDEMVAARHGWRVLTTQVVPPEMAEQYYLALIEVFQYLIGNPDWSAFNAEPGEDKCCHNTRAIGDPGEGPVFSVPYDFDISGLVNTRYADQLFKPADRNLGIRSVRDRIYRGLCSSAASLPKVFALFNEQKEAIYQLYREQPDLDPKVAQETIKYLDEFYETINDPRRVERDHQRSQAGRAGVHPEVPGVTGRGRHE
ncbi:MAG: hypothetical protein HYT81_09295 [Gemmatimonadetes bacterium]|nr:hypothetical protein [Gemmatimonadota bacterium]